MFPPPFYTYNTSCNNSIERKRIGLTQLVMLVDDLVTSVYDKHQISYITYKIDSIQCSERHYLGYRPSVIRSPLNSGYSALPILHKWPPTNISSKAWQIADEAAVCVSLTSAGQSVTLQNEKYGSWSGLYTYMSWHKNETPYSHPVLQDVHQELIRSA